MSKEERELRENQAKKQYYNQIHSDLLHYQKNKLGNAPKNMVRWRLGLDLDNVFLTVGPAKKLQA